MSLSSPSQLPPPPADWWARLHAALMPDYNRPASLYWWLLVVAGAGVWLQCLASLLPMTWLLGLELAAGLLLALAAGLVPVRLPGIKQSLAVGEIFLFLVLLVLGPAAAALAAAGEAFVASFRTSKRWTSRIASPAIASLTMASTGTALHGGLAWLGEAGATSAAATLAATLAFAGLYFFVNAVLTSTVLRLKRKQPVFQWWALLGELRWVGLSYAGSAAIAALLFVTYQAQGGAVLLTMLPLLLLLLLALHFYYRQQEAGLALDQAQAEQHASEAQAALAEAETARRHLLEIKASEQRFHSAFTHAAIAMALLDFDGRVLQANPALQALLGYDSPNPNPQRFQDFVVDEDRPTLQAQMGLAGGREFERFACELRCRHRDGHSVWLALHCSFFTEPGATVPCLILQAQDVSARRDAEVGLHKMAFHDSLTGLPNRRRLLECLEGAVARCRTDAGYNFALMFLDFDRFKGVNDSLGHHAGDQLLRQLGRRVQENLRPSDILARLGGDEFVVLTEHVEHERDILHLAERLMEALKRPFDVGAASVTASASIGITFSSFGYDSAEAVLRDADTAMYQAKGEGKARWALFDSGLHTAVAERLRLEGELRVAVEAGELSVVYQPLFELAGGQLKGFEALLRWQHPTRGLLTPAAFMETAQQAGLMLKLSDFVLHCACQQLRLWQLSQPDWADLVMSVNISAADLAQASFVGRVGRAIVEAGLRPQHLSLEMSENILVAHAEGAAERLKALRALGVRLAVDDFGTGPASLSRLARLPVDSLKIDGSFIRQLQWGSDDSAVVRAIVQLGGSLRKVVVAEGIESAEQMAQLREMGCGFGQGYHLGNPLSALDASALLQARARLH